MTETFDQAWYEAHQAKMARMRGDKSKPLPDFLAFYIPILLPITPNEREHWTAKLRDKKRIRAVVAMATTQYRNVVPLERAKITVIRHSTAKEAPDKDNLYASAKPLIDALCVPSKTHPNGLGFIVDDNAARIELVCLWEHVARRNDQQTEVQIERL